MKSFYNDKNLTIEQVIHYSKQSGIQQQITLLQEEKNILIEQSNCFLKYLEASRNGITIKLEGIEPFLFNYKGATSILNFIIDLNRDRIRFLNSIEDSLNKEWSKEATSNFINKQTK